MKEIVTTVETSTVDNRTTAPSFQVRNPATGKLVETFPHATDTEIESVVEAAQQAFLRWKTLPIENRARVVLRAGEIFREKANELAAIVTEEMGKALSEAKAEIALCEGIFGYYGTHGPSLAADTPVQAPQGGDAMVEKLPIGTLLGIMPWNFPCYQLLRFAIPNLVIGNTVVIKPAESCPRSALLIQEIMSEAGLPAGAYSTIFASHSQIEGMVADPRIQGVSLTGSERAGAAIGELAGRNLKKTVLELGGSDPYIILDTDDVRQSARAAWTTRLSNMGQSCNSNKRMIVMDEVFDEFVSELTRLAKDLKPGDPKLEEDGTFSPMASRAAAEQIAEQVRDAVEKGATLHAGGTLVEGSGAYMAPTVLTGVTEQMRAYHEELFGPVAVVYRVSSEDEAIRLANDSAYGLGASVFSTDVDRATKVARRLETGMTHVNTAAAYGAQLPFGGIKRSGFGRELGPEGMDEFINKRLLYVNR